MQWNEYNKKIKDNEDFIYCIHLMVNRNMSIEFFIICIKRKHFAIKNIWFCSHIIFFYVFREISVLYNANLMYHESVVHCWIKSDNKRMLFFLISFSIFSLFPLIHSVIELAPNHKFSWSDVGRFIQHT